MHLSKEAARCIRKIQSIQKLMLSDNKTYIYKFIYIYSPFEYNMKIWLIWYTIEDMDHSGLIFRIWDIQPNLFPNVAVH